MHGWTCLDLPITTPSHRRTTAHTGESPDKQVFFFSNNYGYTFGRRCKGRKILEISLSSEGKTLF
jgi:hypothetical protein